MSHFQRTGIPKGKWFFHFKQPSICKSSLDGGVIFATMSPVEAEICPGDLVQALGMQKLWVHVYDIYSVSTKHSFAAVTHYLWL